MQVSKNLAGRYAGILAPPPEAHRLLEECLVGFENLSPRRKSSKGVCYGAFPNAEGCSCTPCKIRRYLAS